MTTIFTLFILNGFSTSADVSYRFDSITITSAYTFDVVCTETPHENSFLYEHVLPGDTLSVYVGQLKFMYDGYEVEASDSIMIITNEEGIDIARWLINSWSLESDGETSTFSSHITIDPDFGVVKTIDDFAPYAAVFASNDHFFQLIDHTNTTYTMVPDTYFLETNLNIIVSAYVEE